MVVHGVPLLVVRAPTCSGRDTKLSLLVYALTLPLAFVAGGWPLPPLGRFLRIPSEGLARHLKQAERRELQHILSPWGLLV